MAWLKLDPDFARHPKLQRLTRSDRLYWIELLAYCVSMRNDGRICLPYVSGMYPVRMALQMQRVAQAERFVYAIQEAGLATIERDGDDHVLVLHDFLAYQTSREEDEERRRRTRERVYRHREKKGQPSGSANRKRRQANGSNAVTPGGSNDVTRGGSNAPLPSLPSYYVGREGEKDAHDGDPTLTSRGSVGSPHEGDDGALPLADVGALAADLVARLKDGATIEER